MNRKEIFSKGSLMLFALTILSKGVIAASGFSSGFSYGGYGGSSPVDFLLNQSWTRFLLIFIIFFAIIFFATMKTFKDNKGVAGAIAAAISLLISLALAKNGFLYDYAGDQIGSWILVIAVVIILAFVIKTVYKNLGRGVAGVVIFLIWIVLFFTDPYNIFPSGGGDVAQSFIGIIGFIGHTWLGLALTVIIVILVWAIKPRHRRHDDD